MKPFDAESWWGMIDREDLDRQRRLRRGDYVRPSGPPADWRPTVDDAIWLSDVGIAAERDDRP